MKTTQFEPVAKPSQDFFRNWLVGYLNLMNPLRLAFLLLLSFGLAFQTPQAVAEDAIRPTKTIQLFNGKNLDGWYVWTKEFQYADPNKVFSVVDGQLRITGENWGGVATKASYRDYHLVVEWRWSGKTWPPREKKARDGGILIHGVGEDGAHGGIWLESVESQIIEGGSGDIILVGGANKPSLTANARIDGKETYWDSEGEPVTKNSGRFNWWGRDPQWKDEIGFRGPNDVEKPVGEWNRQEVIANGDKITCILNGTVVIHGYDSSHRAGKIQIQSEGAEMYIRKIELRPLSPMSQPKSPAKR